MSEDSYLDCDVLLVGAGIMSATVGTLLKELDPTLRIEVFERLDRVAGESSEAKNNAGTGHAALCELNYTSLKSDGTVDITKALKVMESFEVSKQFWAWLAKREAVAEETFIRSVPHISFVTGEEDVAFLEKRHAALSASPLFAGMEFTKRPDDLATWIPLMMKGRAHDEPMAATRSLLGTDVNFGELTRGLFSHLKRAFGVEVWLQHEVTALKQLEDKRWLAEIDDTTLNLTKKVRAKFVFIGAGGGALELLEDSDIAEGAGYGGFPVSGQWLVCKNPEVIQQHTAKVYGKAKVGTPPMSVPHLDSRFIDGKKGLLFGPFAGFSTKFLKEGSYLDLPRSFTADNIIPMLAAGLHNIPLTRYLISEVTKSFEERVEALREFIPEAKSEDWELSIAGQRVQVIKKDAEEGGKLEFGTEIISAKDNSLAALLGASPGASTSVSIALDLLADCFPDQMESARWKQRLRDMIPSFGQKLNEQPELVREVRMEAHKTLGLKLPS
jgi:malate dehydrogenase (quinone)